MLQSDETVLNLIKTRLNPLRGSILIHSFVSIFTGDYSDSGPSDLYSVKILKASLPDEVVV